MVKEFYLNRKLDHSISSELKQEALLFIRKTVLADFQLQEKILSKPLPNYHNIPPKEFISTLQELIGSDLTLDKTINSSDVISLPDLGEVLHKRPPSAKVFEEEKLSFNTFNSLLTNSVKADAKDNYRRPYPSAGMQYSVEIFLGLFENKIQDFQRNGLFQYHPKSHQLHQISEISFENLKTAFLNDPEDKAILNNTNIYLFYCLNLNKALYKYLHRGLFFSLMEVGSIYQQMEITTRELGLRSRVWGAFYPNIINRLTCTHPTTIIPVMCQLIGHSK